MTTQPPGDRRHPTDMISLAFGLAFLGVAALWLTAQVVALSPAVVGWIVAVGLLALGGFGLAHVFSARSDRPR